MKLNLMIIIFIGSFSYLTSCVENTDTIYQSKDNVDTSESDPTATGSAPTDNPGSLPDYSNVPIGGTPMGWGQFQHLIDIRGRSHRVGYKTPYKNLGTASCDNLAADSACFCCHAPAINNRSQDLTGRGTDPTPVGTNCILCHQGAGGGAPIKWAPSCYTCHQKRWSECCRGGIDPDTGVAYLTCPGGCGS